MQMARRIQTVVRGERFALTILDGTSSREIVAYEGETIATALLVLCRDNTVSHTPGMKAARAACSAPREVASIAGSRWTAAEDARRGMHVRLPGDGRRQIVKGEQPMAQETEILTRGAGPVGMAA